MIKELIQFTQNLDEQFKIQGVKPKEGLHILLKLQEQDKAYSLDTERIEYELFTKKMLEESDFLAKCKFLSVNAWCISTDKCLDLPAKGIHSCSPFCVAFKKEFLEGGGKNSNNKEKNKKEINNRLGKYFDKALALLNDDKEPIKYESFRKFFTDKECDVYFGHVLKEIEEDFAEKRKMLDSQIEPLKEQQKQATDKAQKESLKTQIASLETQKESVRVLEDSDYIIFYLDEDLDKYKIAHQRYLAKNIFNKADYNTKPNESGKVFGVSDFFNSIDSGGKKEFWKHQTATFDITGRISDQEAKLLYEFQQVLPRKFLPKPLPIFIFKEELQKEVIRIFNESGNTFRYKEIIEKLWDKYQNDFGNYYLLFWDNTKDGVIFKDFDFVSKFDYELKDEHNNPWQIENLFDLKEKESKQFKQYPKLANVFDLEWAVFKNLLSNKYNNNLEYFDDLDSKKYDKLDFTFLAFSKYRLAIYDYIYKSKRQSINHIAFYEIVFNSIRDDLKHNRPYSIKEKLNIWFSLYEKFNHSQSNHHKTMASKLKDYQQFVAALAKNEANLDSVPVEYFAFAAGQVIYYILQKSKSADQSYQRLEPYLQQSKCDQFKAAIANDFARYKHENYSQRFEAAASFVLTYQTDENIKKYLPEILAGVFTNNQLFSDRDKNETKTQAQVTEN